jgi:uncharacterized membrane protein YbhN (UPF0104 family)
MGRRWGWVLRMLAALAVLAGVGWRLASDLRALHGQSLSLRADWLVLCGLLYLVGLGFSAYFWYVLLWQLGQRPALGATLRAYYLGHLGKYLPGKAWALLLRGALIQGPEVRLGTALVTAFYEVLTTMAAGALLSALLFVWQPPPLGILPGHPVVLGLALLLVVGVPLWPAVFNWLAARGAARFPAVEALHLPLLRRRTLAEGLALTSVGWVCFGLSLWTLLQALVPAPPGLTLSRLAQYISMVGLAYVAGFLAVFLPGGVGVREGLLLLLLPTVLPASESAAALAAAAVLLLRLVWTGAELLLAAGLYWLPGPTRQPCSPPPAPAPAPPTTPQERPACDAVPGNSCI